LRLLLIILAPVRRSSSTIVCRGAAVTAVENPAFVTEAQKFSKRYTSDGHGLNATFCEMSVTATFRAPHTLVLALAPIVSI